MFEQFEQLYVEVLYTIKHKIGASHGVFAKHITDLYEYARHAFQVTEEQHNALLAKANKEKVGASYTRVNIPRKL